MDDIALHQQTGSHLARFVSQPSHALLITGPSGSGKRYAAEYLAKQLLQLPATADLYAYPYFRSVLPEKDKTSLGIEAVRELQQFVKLRLPGSGAKRLILVTDAHMLTGEAQNALLKMLEEPAENTTFILTASSGQALLPTIRSRTQQINLILPTKATLTDYFAAKGHATKDVQQAYMMSGGLPGLLHALLEQAEHPLKAAVQTARKLLQSTQFERLCMVDELSKKKPETLQVLFVLQHMARAATAQSAIITDGTAGKRIRQWQKVQQAAYGAEKAYAVSGQAKLALTNLMLAL